MTIHCCGSINIDYVYRVPHFPAPGETLADAGRAVHPGGKGANQATAAAAAGARVEMIAAVGADGAWMRDRLAAAGVGVGHVRVCDRATGHAVILVTPDGENRIVIHGGANRAIAPDAVDAALKEAKPGDWWLCQNETNGTEEAAAKARKAGLRVAYAAAPFDAEAAAAVSPHAELIALNRGEAAALAARSGGAAEDGPPERMRLITEGADGARLRMDGREISVPAFSANPVDTTGAGDVFLGVFLAGLDTGETPEAALRRGAAAAALQVERPGGGDAIPTRGEVDAFLRERG